MASQGRVQPTTLEIAPSTALWPIKKVAMNCGLRYIFLIPATLLAPFESAPFVTESNILEQRRLP